MSRLLRTPDRALDAACNLIFSRPSHIYALILALVMVAAIFGEPA